MESTISLRLPVDVHIRDTFDAIFEYHLSSITVLPDYSALSKFVNALKSNSSELSHDRIFQLLNDSWTSSDIPIACVQ